MLSRSTVANIIKCQNVTCTHNGSCWNILQLMQSVNRLMVKILVHFQDRKARRESFNTLDFQTLCQCSVELETFTQCLLRIKLRDYCKTPFLHFQILRFPPFTQFFWQSHKISYVHNVNLPLLLRQHIYSFPAFYVFETILRREKKKKKKKLWHWHAFHIHV